tara:strand:+ start:621 stop:1028 length:408 start_codon:yes stop_codon:yes gene_type:complete
MSEEKDKKKKLATKKLKRKEKKTNIIPFKAKKDLQIVRRNENPKNHEELEIEKVNEYAKNLCREVVEYVNKASISSGMAYYLLLFHFKQIAIMNLNYAQFRHLDKYTSKELAENHGEFLKEFPELWKKEDIKTVH